MVSFSFGLVIKFRIGECTIVWINIIKSCSYYMLIIFICGYNFLIAYSINLINWIYTIFSIYNFLAPRRIMHHVHSFRTIFSRMAPILLPKISTGIRHITYCMRNNTRLPCVIIFLQNMRIHKRASNRIDIVFGFYRNTYALYSLI